MTESRFPTRDEINRRIKAGHDAEPGDHYTPIDPICCANGLRLSVQASKHHHCAPRNNVGPWDYLEIGFPNRPLKSLSGYAEDPDNLTETVYNMVPMYMVMDVIERYGDGFAKEEADDSTTVL